MKSDKSRKRFVFLCVAPATILFFLFMILPTLNEMCIRDSWNTLQRMKMN